VSQLIEKGEGITDKTKTGIINIDTLSQYFADGETVTLEEIKKRINGFGNTTYIKVLARGTLDKRLIVEADDFSLQAVKMIVLIGGKAIKR
ncbi:MAG: uL15 family ribosomal protein, partial [Clostridia bacterium]|nr:uL15 family ribosomal protein [Clostridia bacterium]